VQNRVEGKGRGTNRTAIIKRDGDTVSSVCMTMQSFKKICLFVCCHACKALLFMFTFVCSCARALSGCCVVVTEGADGKGGHGDLFRR